MTFVIIFGFATWLGLGCPDDVLTHVTGPCASQLNWVLGSALGWPRFLAGLTPPRKYNMVVFTITFQSQPGQHRATFDLVVKPLEGKDASSLLVLGAKHAVVHIHNVPLLCALTGLTGCPIHCGV